MIIKHHYDFDTLVLHGHAQRPVYATHREVQQLAAWGIELRTSGAFRQGCSFIGPYQGGRTREAEAKRERAETL